MKEAPDFYGKGDPLMELAFADCVRWAWGDKEMRAEFERSTGKRLPTTDLESAIDEATGYDEELAGAFARWVIEDVWGKSDG